ncbi:uncharacterized protein [Anabrus simplex]|uniref:uncharacterized protein n=1 Tax=Anabrus simplex TaxID=316456 RepID=UPI0035A3A509
MKEFHTKTCIRFQQWTGQPHQVHITKMGHNCSSDFGVRRDLSVQYLILGDTCWSEEKLIYHMGRILGLQRRPARMRSLESWTNRPPNGRSFDSVTSEGSGGLEQIDAVRAGRIYNCSSGTDPRKGFPSNMSCHFSSHMCGFTSKGELQWELYPTGGVVFTSKKEGTEEHSGSLISPIFHSRNMRDKGNGTGCVEFWYMTQGYGIYNIKVLQRLLSSPLQVLDLDTTPVILQWHSGDLVHPPPSKDNDYLYVSSKLSTDSPFTVEIEFTTAWGVIALDDLSISYTPCPEKHM